MTPLLFEDYALVLHPADTVAVLKRPLEAGAELAGASFEIRLSSDVPAGHKIALRDVAEGQPVLKYGQIIGFANRPIRAGDHVHVHNLAAKEFAREGRISPQAQTRAALTPAPERWFDGYARPGGAVGTRNYLAVISVVNCSASVARQLSDRFPPRGCDGNTQMWMAWQPSPTRAGAAFSRASPSRPLSVSSPGWPGIRISAATS
jgi:altronate dehydratase